jgi:hypothetical protein
MPTRPPIQVCQLCAVDDFVALESTGPDLWQFRCAHGPQHPDRDHVWSPTPAAFFESGRTGVGEELGVYDDLLRCVEPNERAEYGVVEHRYSEVAPASYRELLSRYGHTSLGPTRYSTSFLSHALAQLYREGALARTDVPATGYWHYLRIVPAFAKPEANPDIETTAWTAFATRHGIDPETWPATNDVSG